MTVLQSNNGNNSANNAVKVNAVKDTSNKVQETSKAVSAKTSVKATDIARKRNAEQAAKDKELAAKKAEAVKTKEDKATQAQSKLVKASEMELTTGRNFYAVKTTPKGKEVHYAFETVNERNHWLNRHADSKPTDARSVYRMLKRASNEVVATTRNHRVIKLDYDELVDPNKGARALIK